MKLSPAMNPWRENPEPFFSSKSQFLEVEIVYGNRVGMSNQK